MLAEIDARELAEWEAFYNIDPFGEGRDDLRAGIICSTIHGMAGKIANKAMAPADFMPFLTKPEREPQSPEEQQMLCGAIAAALGQTLAKPSRALNA